MRLTVHSRRNIQHLRSGFTLIELSIVLVIIGLIVGSVLVGRDLIQASAIRATISQKEKFDTAVQTFRLKYNCLPGDCPNVAQFGWTQPFAGFGIVAGNGLIESTNGAAQASHIVPGAETAYFWRQLSLSNLIADAILEPKSTSLLGVDNLEILNPDALRNYLPVSKLNEATFWMVYNMNSQNYYSMFGLIKVQFSYDPKYTFSPVVARQIDQKIDDGMPYTGNVFGLRVSFFYINVVADGNCADGVTFNYLNTELPGCGLSFKASF